MVHHLVFVFVRYSEQEGLELNSTNERDGKLGWAIC